MTKTLDDEAEAIKAIAHLADNYLAEAFDVLGDLSDCPHPMSLLITVLLYPLTHASLHYNPEDGQTFVTLKIRGERPC